ncbi:hypothetical protein MRX96_004917 [Rhipicephalus microplus]
MTVPYEDNALARVIQRPPPSPMNNDLTIHPSVHHCPSWNNSLGSSTPRARSRLSTKGESERATTTGTYGPRNHRHHSIPSATDPFIWIRGGSGVGPAASR